MGFDFITKSVDFIKEIFNSLKDGYLFFGGVGDLIRSLCDIALVTFIIYWALVFLRKSRAWQLIKGIIFVCIFVLVCSLLGLQMVGFLFSNFLYIFAILFVVIFQPELRRILETVGIKTFTSLKGVIGSSNTIDSDSTHSLIDEICDACSSMSKTCTGALILLERNSRLDEFVAQENAERFNSSVTSSVLQSIFYKGAPMHDGAVIIREGKIIATRCHVPLSITMHSLERSGTRHRAAVGASEYGDTIAIVVSEERGSISIALNGRLYEMKDSEELKVNLQYLLCAVIDNQKNKSRKSIRSKKKNSNKPIRIVVAEDETVVQTKYSIKSGITDEIKENNARFSLTDRLLMIIIALLISTGLWIYIQINTNPVISKHYIVPISYNQMTISSDYDVSYPIDTVDVEIVGRKKVIDMISANDIVAMIDFEEVDEAGVYEFPVTVSSRDSSIYFRVEQQIPESISVNVYSN